MQLTTETVIRHQLDDAANYAAARSLAADARTKKARTVARNVQGIARLRSEFTRQRYQELYGRRSE